MNPDDRGTFVAHQHGLDVYLSSGGKIYNFYSPSGLRLSGCLIEFLPQVLARKMDRQVGGFSDRIDRSFDQSMELLTTCQAHHNLIQ